MKPWSHNKTLNNMGFINGVISVHLVCFFNNLYEYTLYQRMFDYGPVETRCIKQVNEEPVFNMSYRARNNLRHGTKFSPRSHLGRLIKRENIFQNIPRRFKFYTQYIYILSMQSLAILFLFLFCFLFLDSRFINIYTRKPFFQKSQRKS